MSETAGCLRMDVLFPFNLYQHRTKYSNSNKRVDTFSRIPHSSVIVTDILGEPTQGIAWSHCHLDHFQALPLELQSWRSVPPGSSLLLSAPAFQCTRLAGSWHPRSTCPPPVLCSHHQAFTGATLGTWMASLPHTRRLLHSQMKPCLMMAVFMCTWRRI